MLILEKYSGKKKKKILEKYYIIELFLFPKTYN